MSPVLLGDIFPNFSLNTTIGPLKLHEWLGDSWGIIFSHPKDFTPVCTTELARVVELYDEFVKRGVKVMALSCDSVEDHLEWSIDILDFMGKKGVKFPYPIIEDKDRKLAKELCMIDPEEHDLNQMPLTARAVFVIGPNKRLKLSILYPATTGRNFDEILRVIDSLQLTASRPLATPVDWKQGEPCMIHPGLSKEEADRQFPGYSIKSVPSNNTYLRFTDKY